MKELKMDKDSQDYTLDDVGPNPYWRLASLLPPPPRTNLVFEISSVLYRLNKLYNYKQSLQFSFEYSLFKN